MTTSKQIPALLRTDPNERFSKRAILTQQQIMDIYMPFAPSSMKVKALAEILLKFGITVVECEPGEFLIGVPVFNSETRIMTPYGKLETWSERFDTEWHVRWTYTNKEREIYEQNRNA